LFSVYFFLCLIFFSFKDFYFFFFPFLNFFFFSTPFIPLFTFFFFYFYFFLFISLLSFLGLVLKWEWQAAAAIWIAGEIKTDNRKRAFSLSFPSLVPRKDESTGPKEKLDAIRRIRTGVSSWRTTKAKWFTIHG